MSSVKDDVIISILRNSGKFTEEELDLYASIHCDVLMRGKSGGHIWTEEEKYLNERVCKYMLSELDRIWSEMETGTSAFSPKTEVKVIH